MSQLNLYQFKCKLVDLPGKLREVTQRLNQCIPTTEINDHPNWCEGYVLVPYGKRSLRSIRSVRTAPMSLIETILHTTTGRKINVTIDREMPRGGKTNICRTHYEHEYDSQLTVMVYFSSRIQCLEKEFEINQDEFHVPFTLDDLSILYGNLSYSVDIPATYSFETALDEEWVNGIKLPGVINTEVGGVQRAGDLKGVFQLGESWKGYSINYKDVDFSIPRGDLLHVIKHISPKRDQEFLRFLPHLRLLWDGTNSDKLILITDRYTRRSIGLWQNRRFDIKVPTALMRGAIRLGSLEILLVDEKNVDKYLNGSIFPELGALAIRKYLKH